MVDLPVVDKQLCTSAFEKLGPDMVLRGHVAIEHSQSGDWDACFLAMCFGGYGALARLTDGVGQEYGVPKALGLTLSETWAVTDAFDNHRAEFQVLVEEWLERNVEQAQQPPLRIPYVLGPRELEAAFWARRFQEQV